MIRAVCTSDGEHWEQVSLIFIIVIFASNFYVLFFEGLCYFRIIISEVGDGRCFTAYGKLLET